ncbi:MAG TPA: hypothetical protein VMF61_10655 [Candidatus Acidoferrales bacterium]|nr:hypothetical protein [Candidatus Acidoferrales bacterium]
MLLAFALVACAPTLPPSGGSSPLAGTAPAGRGAAKDTIFITVAGQPGAVTFAAPPYSVWASSQSIFEAIPLGLNARGDLFVGEDQPSGLLEELGPPYTAPPKQVGTLSYAIGLVVDKHNNVWVAENNSVQEYSPPSYKLTNTLHHPNQQLNYPQSIVALPSGQLAVGRTESAAGVTAAPGAVDIYTQKSAHHFLKSSIKNIPYPEALAVDHSGNLVVAECSACVSAGQTDNLLLSVPPPYKKVTRVIQELPNVSLEEMAVAPQGDLFLNESGTIFRYSEPFTSGHPLSQTSYVSALNVDSAGDLIYISGSSVYLLNAPYRGKPSLILAGSGTLEQIATSP